MRTREGDVIVSHSGSEQPSFCAVWTVEADLRRTPNASAYVATALGAEAAFTLAKKTIRKRHGAVFLSIKVHSF